MRKRSDYPTFSEAELQRRHQALYGLIEQEEITKHTRNTEIRPVHSKAGRKSESQIDDDQKWYARCRHGKNLIQLLKNIMFTRLYRNRSADQSK